MSTSANPPNVSAEEASHRKEKLRAHIKSVLSTIRNQYTGRTTASMRASRYTLGTWFWGARAAPTPLFT
jgi:hypothetical protein